MSRKSSNSAGLSRRTLLAGTASLLATPLVLSPARAQAKPINIGVIMPLSGANAQFGINSRNGIELVADEINAAGGIKALGGAKLRLMQYDTGDSAEKAKDAAQRMIAQEPALVGGFGCWLSTFTLAATEVTERAELPWLTLSYSDLITNRGFHYVFQTSPTADFQAESLVPTIMELAEKTTGKRPTKVGIVGDNTASSVSFYKPLHDHTLKDQKLDLVVEKI